VCLLERQDRVGRKLLATGNGRCNLSHENVADTNYHGRHPGFVSAVLRQFGNLSSASVFFVLQAALEDSTPNGYWWMSHYLYTPDIIMTQ